MERSLPFERGTTWRGNTSKTTAPDTKLAGRVFCANDGDLPVGEGHGTGVNVDLIVLKQGASTVITPSLGRRGYQFKAGTGAEAGYTVQGIVTAPGRPGILLDDAYQLQTSLAIGQNDYFYGVLSGPATGVFTTPRNGAFVAGHTKLAFNTTGHVRCATVGDEVIGIAGTTASATATTGASVTVLVGHPLANRARGNVV